MLAFRGGINLKHATPQLWKKEEEPEAKDFLAGVYPEPEAVKIPSLWNLPYRLRRLVGRVA